MSGYTVYQIKDTQLVGPPLTIQADDDNAAIEEAIRIINDCDVEIWQSGRLVTRVPRPLADA
jgi:hypothetical protein